jgi:hypothetical protein
LIKFDFNKGKAIEAILYVVNKMSGLDGGWLYDILYSADKLHLERYGRSIFGEMYGATSVQVVPLNVMKLIYAKDAELFEAISNFNGWIDAKRECNRDELSKSDEECLEQSVKNFSVDSQGKYDEAWHKARSRHPNKRVNDIYIEDVVNQFENSKDLLDYLQGIDEIEALWR